VRQAVLGLDQRLGHENPLNSSAKLQDIVSKCKTADKIELCTLLLVDFVEPGLAMCNKNETNIVFIIL